MTIKVGIDVDDTLTSTMNAWIQRHNEITGDNVKPEDIKSWDIAQYIKKGDRDTLFAILRQDDFWDTVKPIDGAVDYLWKLINDNDDIDVYIVTATHPETAKIKMRRLFNHFPFIDEEKLVMTTAKEILNLDLMVDDNPENLCKMPSGCFKILFDAPHNQWCNEDGIGAIRVRNWDEVYKYVTTIAWLESEEYIEA